jgi:nucleoid-associated protein YgaU
MDTKHRKALIKSELAVWHWLGRVREHIGAIVASVLTGVLLVGGVTLGLTFLQEPSPAGAPAAQPTAQHYTPRHAAHKAPLEVHHPRVEPIRHVLVKHERNYIVVRPGDSLWLIAERYLHDAGKWIELAQKNHLANPNVLEVGQRIHL